MKKETQNTLLEHSPDVLRSGLVVQVLCGEFESIQEPFNIVCRLILQHLYAPFHIYLGGLSKSAVGMDVVVKNDDSHHHPHAKQECVLAAEATRIFRCLQHDLTDAGHGAEAICRVLQRKSFVLRHKVCRSGAQRLQHGRGLSVEQRHPVGHLVVDFIFYVQIHVVYPVPTDGPSVVAEVVLDGGNSHLELVEAQREVEDLGELFGQSLLPLQMLSGCEGWARQRLQQALQSFL